LGYWPSTSGWGWDSCQANHTGKRVKVAACKLASGLRYLLTPLTSWLIGILGAQLLSGLLDALSCVCCTKLAGFNFFRKLEQRTAHLTTHSSGGTGDYSSTSLRNTNCLLTHRWFRFWHWRLNVLPFWRDG
jgi:hypothetical protein